MVNTKALARLIRELLDLDDDVFLQSVHGGDIHDSFKVTFANAISIGDERLNSVFVKRCTSDQEPVLKSEFDSLLSIAALTNGDLHYPQPIQFHRDDQQALLIMRFYEIQPLDSVTAADAGSMLAQQHQYQSDVFGWHQDNFIGLTPQLNASTTDWSDFYVNYRLMPQIELAAKNGISPDLLTRLNKCCDTIFQILAIHTPKPSLLHGDLWTGNLGVDRLNNRPILYDPAPYYGDPEVDIAMTELFGALPSTFYQAYQRVAYIADGRAIRTPIYHLYHALNHFNLFGIGYESMVERFIFDIENNCK